MSTRTNLRPTKVIDAQSMSTDLTSHATVLQSLTGVAYEIDWVSGSTPVGTLTLEVSNSYSLNPDGSVANAGTWTTAPLIDSSGTVVTSISISGNSGNDFIEVPKTGAYATRVKYTRASGTATMTAIVSGKVS